MGRCYERANEKTVDETAKQECVSIWCSLWAQLCLGLNNTHLNTLDATDKVTQFCVINSLQTSF